MRLLHGRATVVSRVSVHGEWVPGEPTCLQGMYWVTVTLTRLYCAVVSTFGQIVFHIKFANNVYTILNNL